MHTLLSAHRLLTLLLVLALSGVAGLAMATAEGGIGANLLGRWLVGWAATMVILLPLARLLTRGYRGASAPGPALPHRVVRRARVGDSHG